MKNNILGIIGSQYGDEGKGKFIDLLSNEYDIIVRYQGGDNAGHTIVINGEKHKLRLIPSGIFANNKTIIIGNGVVVNLRTLLQEIDYLKAKNISVDNLLISNKAHVIFDYHIQLDKLNEENKGLSKIGTTCRGIGPCYTDKVARIGIRICDLFNIETLEEKIKAALHEKNILFKHYNWPTFDATTLADEYYRMYLKIKDRIIDSSVYLNNAINENKKILLEGAQGVLLDIDHGTYPFVTSSNVASQMSGGSGIGITKINDLLGIVKAYVTRVGSGPFISEIHTDEATYIRERGNEYGTVTKRPRRIGWIDIVALNYSINLAGINQLAITLLDVLSGLDKIKLCVGYMYENEIINYIPPNNKEYSKCIPVYVTVDGWNEDISHCTSIKQLPVNCQKYLLLIQKLLKTPIKYVSVGPDRNQTFEIGE